jgi:hypothetical protein
MDPLWPRSLSGDDLAKPEQAGAEELAPDAWGFEPLKKACGPEGWRNRGANFLMNIFLSKRTTGGDVVQIGERDGLLGIYNASRGRWCCQLSARDLAFELGRAGRDQLTPQGLAWLLKFEEDLSDKRAVPADMPQVPACDVPTISCRRKMRRTPGWRPKAVL